MVSRTKKFIFTRINKTASTSVGKTLRPYIASRDLRRFNKHARTHTMLNDANKFYFKFAFVRNPWDRLFSVYCYRVRCNILFPKKCLKKPTTSVTPSFERWLNEIYDPDSIYHYKLEGFRSQLDYLSDYRGVMLNDFVGRFENLQSDCDKIMDRLSLPKVNLPKVNVTKHPHYSTVYTNKLIDVIAERYADDIDYFNYDFLPS